MEDRIVNSLWNRISGLFQFAHEQLGTLDGKTSCSRLRKLGQHVVCEDSVLVKVQIQQRAIVDVSGSELRQVAGDHAGQVAVLRMRLSDWLFLGQFVDELSAIWTQINIMDGSVVLDSTIGPAFLTGHIPLARHEALKMAEVFCGGFCGWTQAAYCLRDAGVPIKTCWLLDSDAELIDPIRTAHPDIKVTFGPSDFDKFQDLDDTVFLKADLNEGWWHRVWAGRTPDLIAASPPCQPWSTAGHQGGLQCPDGVFFPHPGLNRRNVGGSSCLCGRGSCLCSLEGFWLPACIPGSQESCRRLSYASSTLTYDFSS